MVTKLKDNLSYIEYIRKEMKEKFPKWKEEYGTTAYEGQVNSNFRISFDYLDKKISFVKDRGLLELGIYEMNDLIDTGNRFYNSLLEHIPEQDSKWRLSICTELIDYYIDCFKNYYET